MKVLVTGANGHLGYNLIERLLQTGHTVRGSIRSVDDTAKVERLKLLGEVEVVEAELNNADQLRAAMEGIDVLFHTAAVYKYVAPGMASEIVNASVKGIEKAFHAAAAAKVKKIVLTSSIVTLPLTLPGASPSTEKHWQDDTGVPYIRAKTQGEKLAWEMAEKLKLNLVTVLPGAITGPGFVKNTPTIDIIEAMMLGGFRFGVPNMYFPLVDVRDVASAHILAAEKDCHGRFLACNDSFPTFKEMVEVLHKIDQSISLPLMTLPDFMKGALVFFDNVNQLVLGTPRTISTELSILLKNKIWNVSNQRIKDTLSWEQSISLEQTLKDTMAVLRQLKSQKK